MQDTAHATRLHALDAVRAVALLLGVALHAALSYAPGVDSHLWPLADSQKGVVMSVGTFLIHISRMPVFFLLAGFFAHMMFHREGTRLFLQNRAKRILLPLVLGWFACFLSIAGVVLWHLVRTNGGRMPACGARQADQLAELETACESQKVTRLIDGQLLVINRFEFSRQTSM